GFRERADEVLAVLRSDETRFVLVASPRHDTVTEAAWFAEQLDRQGLSVSAAIVNRMQPTYGGWTADEAARAASDARADGESELAALWQNVAEMAALADAERQAVDPLRRHVGD